MSGAAVMVGGPHPGCVGVVFDMRDTDGEGARVPPPNGDVPVDGRVVVVCLRVGRLACPVLGGWCQTFREQIPGLLERDQRRAVRLAGQMALGGAGVTPSGQLHAWSTR